MRPEEHYMPGQLVPSQFPEPAVFPNLTFYGRVLFFCCRGFWVRWDTGLVDVLGTFCGQGIIWIRNGYGRRGCKLRLGQVRRNPQSDEGKTSLSIVHPYGKTPIGVLWLSAPCV